MDALAQVELIQSYRDALHQEGVVICRDQITSEDIEQLRVATAHIREIVMQKISHMKRPLKVYADIVERHLNRLDYRCGFTADVFLKVAQPIHHLIKTFSPTIDFRHYWGAIPSLSGGTNGYAS